MFGAPRFFVLSGFFRLVYKPKGLHAALYAGAPAPAWFGSPHNSSIKANAPLSAASRSCPAALRLRWPPQASRLDPRDAYCSRNPPRPHHSRCAMRPLSPPDGAPRPRTACSLPLARAAAAIEEPGDASAAVHSPPLPRVSPHKHIPIYAADARAPPPPVTSNSAR